jgi:hypothetical protein
MTPIRGIRGIYGISRDSRARDRNQLPFYFIFIDLQMAGALHPHGPMVTWPDAVAATGGGDDEECKTVRLPAEL